MIDDRYLITQSVFNDKIFKIVMVYFHMQEW